jgi:uncharacterized iron-regulated protein
MKLSVHHFCAFVCIGLFLNACTQPRCLSHQIGQKDKEIVFSLREAREISKERLLEQLDAYPVIFIGDFHQNDTLHNFVAGLIRQLGKNYRLHLANEWFTPADNTLLKAFVDKNISEESFLEQIDWEKNIGFEYKSFKPIYQALKEVKGEMYGINLSKQERKKISLQLRAEMNASETSFYEGLDLNVSVHQQLLAPFLSHCHALLEGESEAQCLKRMYRVQVAWDKKMGMQSAHLAKTMLKSDKDKLVVFIGALHLESGLGANMRFARLSTKPFVTILPQNSPSIRLGSADFVYFVSDEQP